LRVTHGTALARAGVRLQVVQRLMRHSTPVLTANVYTRLELHDLRGAVGQLGSRQPASARALRV
jgi:integrase